MSNFADIWRIAFAADGATQLALTQAIEDVVDSVSAMESAPGGPWRIEGLTQFEPDRADIAARLKRAADEIGVAPPDPVIERLPDIDWLAENRKSFPPLRVGRFFVYGSHIKEPPPQGTHAIALDAGIAFGSGEHATTKGCLLAIDRLARRRRCTQNPRCRAGARSPGSERRPTDLVGGALQARSDLGAIQFKLSETFDAPRPAGGGLHRRDKESTPSSIACVSASCVAPSAAKAMRQIYAIIAHAGSTKESGT